MVVAVWCNWPVTLPPTVYDSRSLATSRRMISLVPGDDRQGDKGGLCC